MQPYAALSLLHSRPNAEQLVNPERPANQVRTRRFVFRSKRVSLTFLSTLLSSPLVSAPSLTGPNVFLGSFSCCH